MSSTSQFLLSESVMQYFFHIKEKLNIWEKTEASINPTTAMAVIATLLFPYLKEFSNSSLITYFMHTEDYATDVDADADSHRSQTKWMPSLRTVDREGGSQRGCRRGLTGSS